MKIAERPATSRRERRVLLRVPRAAWRLDQTGREHGWALASARSKVFSHSPARRAPLTGPLPAFASGLTTATLASPAGTAWPRSRAARLPARVWMA